MPIEANIKEIGTIKRIAKPFNQALAQFYKEGRNLISARDLAYSRILRGPEHSLSTNGSYVKEGAFYIQDKTLIPRVSLLTDLNEAEKAVKAHKQLSEYYCEDLAEKQLKIAEKDSSKPFKDRRIFIYNKRGFFNVLIDNLPKDELFKYLFLDQVIPYAEFLDKAKISEVLVRLSNNQEKSFVNQFWLGGLVSQSHLSADGGRYLDGSYVVRGAKAKDK